MAYMPSFLAWLFVRHSKITKLFQVSQLSSDFFWVSSIFHDLFRCSLSHFSFSLFSSSLFFEPLGALRILRCSLRLFSFFSFLISEPLGVLRIASLVYASLLLLLSVFSLSIFSYSISSSLSHLSISISISSISISSSSSSLSLVSSLVLYCVLFFSFSFSSLSHLTFPASFRYSLRLFSFFLFSDFRVSWCSPHRFFFLFSCFLFTFFLSCSLFFLSHLTFHAYLSLLSHYPLIDSEQCDKPLFLILVAAGCAVCPWNPAFCRTNFSRRFCTPP